MTVAVAVEKAAACFASGDKHPVAKRLRARVAAAMRIPGDGRAFRLLKPGARVRSGDNSLCMNTWNTERCGLSTEKVLVPHEFWREIRTFFP